MESDNVLRIDSGGRGEAKENRGKFMVHCLSGLRLGPEKEEKKLRPGKKVEHITRVIE